MIGIRSQLGLEDAFASYKYEVECPLLGGRNKTLLPKHPQLGFINLRITGETEYNRGSKLDG